MLGDGLGGSSEQRGSSGCVGNRYVVLGRKMRKAGINLSGGM